MVAAGRLRHRVMLQRQEETRDPESGAVTVNWVDVDPLWASVEPLSAREFIAAQATQSKVSARITIRYRDDVTAKDRMSYHGKVYNIEGVLPDLDSGLEYLTLPVSQGVNDGR